MATFECCQCHILFEDLVSKNKEWDTPGDFIYGLSEDIMCLRCSSKNTKVWNLESGMCPMCSCEMKYVVEGMQRVKLIE